jgi:hypothetical protein
MLMNEKTSPKVKTFSFGACNIASTSPELANLFAATKKLNVRLSFEDALKLHLAIGECARTLNGYNRSTKAGKKLALNLTIHLDMNRLTVNEWPPRKKQEAITPSEE